MSAFVPMRVWRAASLTAAAPVALSMLLGARPGEAQGDSIPLADVTKVRILAPQLGTGWHEGRLV